MPHTDRFHASAEAQADTVSHSEMAGDTVSDEPTCWAGAPLMSTRLPGKKCMHLYRHVLGPLIYQQHLIGLQQAGPISEAFLNLQP